MKQVAGAQLSLHQASRYCKRRWPVSLGLRRFCGSMAFLGGNLVIAGIGNTAR